MLLTASDRFRVALPGPLDLPQALERFRRWGDDLLERWDGETYVWTVPIEGRRVAFAARIVGSIEAPSVDVEVEAGASAGPSRDAISNEIVARLVPTTAARRALDELVEGGSDPVVGSLEARFPGLRPVLQRDVLIALVRSVSAQQINLTWAATIRRRLAESYGTEHTVSGMRVMSLDPERLAGADPAHLRALQFTNRKAASIVACAAAVAGGGFELETLDSLEDDEVIERLVALPGIGPWTAEWLLARTLGRPRVVAGDLGVRKAVGEAYLWNRLAAEGRRLPSEDEVRLATAHWGLAAGIAQQLLLHALGAGMSTRELRSAAPVTQAL